MKRKYNDNILQYTPSLTYRKVGHTWFACNSYKVLKHTENVLKVQTSTVCEVNS